MRKSKMKALSIILFILAGICSCANAELNISTKYLRIVGLGNSENQWNSILEVVFPELPYSNQEILIRASSHDENLPEYAMDNDLNTRFSAVGPGQWISFEFPEVVQLSKIEIAFSNSAQRIFYFYIEKSMDNESWSPVYLGTTTEGNPGFETVSFSESRQQELRQLLAETGKLHERTKKLYESYKAQRDEKTRNSLAFRYYDLLAWLEYSFSQKHIIPYKTPFHYSLGEVEEIVTALEQGNDYLDTTDTPEIWWAHYSVPDDSTQPFILHLPGKYDPGKSYPLVVELHGHGVRPRLSDDPESTGNFFHVFPLVRGDNSYEGIGDVTVRELIDYMVRAFPIDVEKIHITGESMGGRGTWNMATRHADLFASAAPYYGYAQDLYLQNLRQLPLFISHGLKDFVVPSDNSLYARDILDGYHIPSIYNEYPEEPHSARKMIRPYAWQAQHTNKDRDQEFEFITDHPFRGKHYWAEILAMENPRKEAIIKAKVDRSKVELQLTNVSMLKIDTKIFPVDSRKVKFRINGKVLRTTLSADNAPLLFKKTGKKYRIETATADQADHPGPCLSGGAGNLYTGEPLLIVYGTGGQPSKVDSLKQLAHEISLHCTPRARMVGGAFSVKADVEVDAGDLAHYNLLLVGGPGENAVSAKVYPSVPLRETESELVIDGLKALPLEELWYGFYHYNPIEPQKRLFLVNLDHVSDSEVRKLEHQLDLVVPGMDVSRPMSTPDLIAVSKGKIARRLQLDTTWNWAITSDYQMPAPSVLFDRESVALAYAKAIQMKCGTDFGLFSERDLTINHPLAPEFFSLGDFKTDNRSMPAFIAGASSEQVKLLVAKLVSEGKLVCYPEPVLADLDPDKTYTLAINPNSFWFIRYLQTNFISVRSGPEIGPFVLQ